VPHGALCGHVDRYNGIKVADDKIAPSTTIPEFRDILASTVNVYKEQGFTGVWLKLHTD